jgi:hypothetical protein
MDFVWMEWQTQLHEIFSPEDGSSIFLRNVWNWIQYKLNLKVCEDGVLLQ